MSAVYQLFRKDAPETSKAAGRAANTNKMEAIVLSVVRKFGDAGCLRDDIHVALPRVSQGCVSGRIAGLLEKGLIKVVGEREGIYGRMQRVMVAV